jgi:hypothetical protein
MSAFQKTSGTRLAERHDSQQQSDADALPRRGFFTLPGYHARFLHLNAQDGVDYREEAGDRSAGQGRGKGGEVGSDRARWVVKSAGSSPRKFELIRISWLAGLWVAQRIGK